MMRIILASASPRRKELLAKLFPQFEVFPAKGEERCTKSGPGEAAMELSGGKAGEIEQEIAAGSLGDCLIIGADTVVALEGRILGKPAGPEDAIAALRMLSGNAHQVYTGITLILYKGGIRKCIQFAECTDVKFYKMLPWEIEAYVQTGEPADKAGSYGIQGIGGRFVEKIHGDYNNVVGLPVAKLYQVLKEYIEMPIAL